MNKLLFFASDYRIGLSALLVDEAIAFHQQGIPMLCLAGEKEQEKGLKRFMEDNGVPLLIVEGLDVHRNFFKLARRVNQIIEEYAITHIHVQNNWQLAIITYIKFFLRCSHNVELYYTIHGFRNNNFFKSVIARILIGVLLWVGANRVICPCKYLQDVFFPLKYKSVLLPLGVSDAFFASCELPSVQACGLQIIYPAQFRKGKNQEFVIRSFADYLKKTGDTKSHLWLLGGGDLRAKAEDLVSSLGLKNRVTLPGQCAKDKIIEYYKKCNVAIVASNSETFGQSIVEPWVMGLIVVSRPVGVAPDIINSNKTGFLFQKIEQLTSTLELISNHPEYQELVKNNTAFYRQQFSWITIANQYKIILLNNNSNT